MKHLDSLESKVNLRRNYKCRFYAESSGWDKSLIDFKQDIRIYCVNKILQHS
ncbi:hypothetical protein DCO58_10425 [Helicobacter saguini]|nr:hypothetical protein [Helicobacter saguini]